MTSARFVPAILALCIAFTFGTTVHAQQSDSKEQKQPTEDVTKGSKNINEVATHSMEDLHRALKLAMETYGFEVKKNQPDYLEGTRERHVGLFLGSGGEKVKIKLTKDSKGTRVKVDTGKGLIGALGKKNWSTPIYKEALNILSGK